MVHKSNNSRGNCYLVYLAEHPWVLLLNAIGVLHSNNICRLSGLASTEYYAYEAS